MPISFTITRSFAIFEPGLMHVKCVSMEINRVAFETMDLVPREALDIVMNYVEYRVGFVIRYVGRLEVLTECTSSRFLSAYLRTRCGNFPIKDVSGMPRSESTVGAHRAAKLVC